MAKEDSGVPLIYTSKAAAGGNPCIFAERDTLDDYTHRDLGYRKGVWKDGLARCPMN